MNTQNLSGKVAFITGGVSGIGLGIARTFVKAGMKVAITYKRKDHVAEAMACFSGSEGEVIALQLDVSDHENVTEVAQRVEAAFGKVHIVCNNAGVNAFGPTDLATKEDWDWILGVNLGGAINVLRALLPGIKRHGEGGHIINVASMAAFVPVPEAGLYTTSKFALRGWSESLRFCLAPYEIGVSLFCPGLVKSRIYESLQNRPHGPTSFTASTASVQRWQHLQSLGMDPMEAGEILLHGLQANDFYIFSHPGFKAELEDIFMEIVAAVPDGSAPPPRKYVEEARRQRLKEFRRRLRIANDSSL